MRSLAVAFALIFLAWPVSAADWPNAEAPVIPAAAGFVCIPGVEHAPAKDRIYRAVWDATRDADAPGHLLPAIDMAGSELNALGASRLPVSLARFVLVFHGPAVNGILDAEAYRAKFGVDNPNLEALAQMKKVGVEMFVCGQYLAAEKIDPRTLSKDVRVASDALLVLIEYQQDGYALMGF